MTYLEELKLVNKDYVNGNKNTYIDYLAKFEKENRYKIVIDDIHMLYLLDHNIKEHYIESLYSMLDYKNSVKIHDNVALYIIYEMKKIINNSNTFNVPVISLANDFKKIIYSEEFTNLYKNNEESYHSHYVYLSLDNNKIISNYVELSSYLLDHNIDEKLYY